MDYKYEHLKDIPNEVVEYVEGMMEQESGSDRIRIVEVGNSDHVKKYEDIRSRGCCGHVDYQRVPFKVNGKEYYYGFNFGH